MAEQDRRIEGASAHCRVEELLQEQHLQICRATDRLFVGLMLVQWIGGIAAAVWLSPRTWIGATSEVHLHVWAAVLLGGAISSLPVYLGLKHPGRPLTRRVIAAAQVMWSALLIHLMGGRIETHFHIFVSLAFLSFYREWRLLILPTLIVTVDHAIRGLWWPQSVYGVFVESPFRCIEHAAWIMFEVVILAICCRRSSAEMRELAERQERLETTNRHIEDRVEERTHRLMASEQRLSTSEARLRAMLDSTLDPMITINVSGVIQTASRSVETVFGWRPQELIGKSVNVLLAETHRSETDEQLAQYLSGDESTLLGQIRELPAVRRDGSIFPCELKLWKVNLPGPAEPLFMGAVRDITERKQAEAARARFLATMEASPEAVFLIDRKTLQFIDMNETACADMGYSRDELLAMRPVDIKPHFTERELAQKFDEIIESEEQVGVIETQHCRRDGSTFPVEVYLRALRSDDGAILIASVRDVTERKRSEAELESLHKQLIDAARQAGKAEIATSVLHNVGNVLNSVNVSAGLIQGVVAGSSVSNLTQAVDVMEQHLDDLGAYVTQDDRGKHLPRFLIDLSRQLASEEQLILEEVESLISNIEHIKVIVTTQQSYAKDNSGFVDEVALAELVEEAIHVNIASMKRHSVDVVQQIEDLKPVLVDKHRLLQILVNLIGNAKHACIDGGRADQRLTVRLRRSGDDRVAIEVQDNGVGIAAENLTRIFAHGFTTRDEGHGFGLHSAAIAAKGIGGTLTARSDGLGAGATFILELPYKTARVLQCSN